jgi:phosphate-selective porin OprO/OprP
MNARRRIAAPLAGLLCLAIPACESVDRPEIHSPVPVGRELVDEQDPKPQEPAEEESEVLEERRRGFSEEEAATSGESARLFWLFGPRLDALRGDLSLVVGGRLHADAADFSMGDEIVDAFGEPNPGVELRRAFVELGGVYRQMEFNFWVNFAQDFQIFTGDVLVNSDPDFRNVFVGLFDLPVVGGVRAGYFKEPFGLEEITSSNDITFMERSLTDAFIERRNLGVMVHERFTSERRITTAFGFFQDANNDLEVADGYGVTGRVTGLPWYEDEGRRLLHLGAAATFRHPSDDQLRFLSRPESAQAQIMGDTGTFDADRDFRYGLEAAIVYHSWSLQSEFIGATARRVTGEGDPSFTSFYVMASHVLTGEHRSYRKQVGAFGSVHPDRQFPAGGMGAWELTGRYSYLDLDSREIRGGVLQDWTAGVNWYLNDQMRMMFNYIAARPEGFDVEHIFQMRFQLSF